MFTPNLNQINNKSALLLELKNLKVKVDTQLKLAVYYQTHYAQALSSSVGLTRLLNQFDLDLIKFNRLNTQYPAIAEHFFKQASAQLGYLLAIYKLNH